MGWLSGWDYRKSHTLTGSSAGAQTYYQMRVKVHRSSGEDSGEDVYVGTKCREDFGDIRFTKADETTPLDYWLEEIVGSVATFWVEVDSIPDSPSTIDIYIYYGNSGATTTSDGEDTFLLFDNFDDNDFDTAKWDLITGSMLEQNQRLEGQSPGAWDMVRSDDTFAYHIALHITARGTMDLSGWDFYFGYEAQELMGVQNVDTWKIVHKGGFITWDTSPPAFVDDVWYKLEIRIDGAKTWWLIDDVEYNYESNSTANNLRMQVDTSLEGQYDNAFIRKFVDPEPAHTSWGDEETSVVVPTVTTQAATGLTVGAGTLHGTITATGGENADERGFDWDYDSGAPYAYEETDLGDFGVGVFEEVMSGFTEGNTVYFRAKANNSAGWGYGGELNFVVRKAISRSASAAMGLVGATDRAFIGTRSSPGTIGVAGVSTRNLLAVRSAAPSLSMVAVATRSQILERVASATLSLVGVPERILGALRLASATLGITGATDRVYIAVRSAGATMGMTGVSGRIVTNIRAASATVSLVGTATRSWIGSRTASASLGVSAVASAVKTVIRSASASMSVVAVAARSWVGSRPASAGLSLSGSPSRILSAFREATATLSLSGTASRIKIMTRSAAASLGMTGVANRTLHALRSAVATMGIAGTALRSWVGSRSASATMTITGTSARMLLSIRSASASLSQTATAIRSGVFTRAASGAMAIQGTADRMYGAIRSAAATISSSAVSARTLILERSAAASMSLVAVSGRAIQIVRSAAASMSITAVGWIYRRIIGGIVKLKFAGKTRILDFADKERTLLLSYKQRVLDFAHKIRKLKFGRKET